MSVSGIEVSDIPIEYTKLTYIESSGKQWVNTGVTGGTSSAYEIKFNNLGAKTANYEQYFGGGADAKTSKLYDSTYESIGTVMNNGADIPLLLFNLEDAVHTVKLTETPEVYVDDTLLTGWSTEQVMATGWGTTNWYVCADPNETNLASFMRLYYLKMWKDGELVRDFVPAKRDSDGAIGLYDKVTATFFGNAGTGTFAYG